MDYLFQWENFTNNDYLEPQSFFGAINKKKHISGQKFAIQSFPNRWRGNQISQNQNTALFHANSRKFVPHTEKIPSLYRP